MLITAGIIAFCAFFFTLMHFLQYRPDKKWVRVIVLLPVLGPAVYFFSVMRNAEKKGELTFFQQWTYAGGEMGVSLTPTIVVGWLLYYYTKASDVSYLPMPLFAIAFVGVFGRVIDAVADPAVGYYSDKIHTRMGRRIPWVVFGTPMLLFTFVAMWFPVINGSSWWNFVWLILMVGGFWFFYTAVVAPYLSLLPEITYLNDERVTVSMYMGFADVFGMVVAFLLGTQLMEKYRDGLSVGPVFLSDGYKVMGIILGVIMAFFFFLSVGWVREKPHSKDKEVPFKFFEAFVFCLKNKAFIPYVIAMGFFRVAVDVIVAAIPFIVDSLMYYSEDMAGYLQAGIIIVAAFLFPLVEVFSTKYGKKKVFVFGMFLFSVMMPLIIFSEWIPALLGIDPNVAPRMAGNARLLYVIILFVIATFPIACAFVLQRAIIADVIDLDAKHTGYRREAMYNGMEGLITKFAAAIATAMIPLFMWLFGDGDKCGILGPLYGLGPQWGLLLVAPASGVLLYFGYIAFKRYPIEK